jgi:hypothetical protein
MAAATPPPVLVVAVGDVALGVTSGFGAVPPLILRAGSCTSFPVLPMNRLSPPQASGLESTFLSTVGYSGRAGVASTAAAGVAFVRTGDSAVPEEEPDMRRVEPWWISLPTGNLRSSQKVSRPNEQRARLEDKEIVGWSQPLLRAGL